MSGTVTIRDAASARWDLVVVGAGPAGAIAALHAARRGASVLLVDKARFPRDKPCGCCLDARAVGALRSAGLEPALAAAGARRLERLVLAAGGRRARVPLRSVRVLSRAALDAIVVRAAVRAGASFLPEARALAGPAAPGRRAVLLAGGATEEDVEAGAVIVADGLGGRALGDDPRFAARIRDGARVGVAAIVAGESVLDDGEIEMACGAGGYVGAVRLEDGRVDVAAALDPSFVRATGGAAAACAAIRASAGLAAIDGLAGARWCGAPAMTRRRLAVAADRVFVVGDAAGFVEPFTGEGIGWALAAGAAVAPIAAMAARAGDRDARRAGRVWMSAHRRAVARRELRCRALAAILREPRLVAAATAALAACTRTAGRAPRPRVACGG